MRRSLDRKAKPKRKLADTEPPDAPPAKRTRSATSAMTPTKKTAAPKTCFGGASSSAKTGQWTLRTRSNNKTLGAANKAVSKAPLEQKPKADRKSKKAEANPFWSSRFIQVNSIPQVNLGDLTNDIHPVFQDTKFPNGDYNIIEIPARLATRFLESPILLSFFLTLAYRGKLIDLGEEQERYGKLYGYTKADTAKSKMKMRKGRSLKEDVRKRDAALQDVARMVRFVSDTKFDNGAVTVRERRPIQPASELFPKARASKIRYSDALYQRLYNATRTTSDAALILVCRFEFAIMLVHEICHALVNAKEGDLGSEPFFHNSDFAEAGFELEDRLFGGHFSILFDAENDDGDNDRGDARVHRYPGRGSRLGRLSVLRGVPVIWKWPSRGVIRSYLESGDYIGIRDGVELPERDLAWRLPIEFIAKFFTTAFWDAHGADPEQFLPPNDVGHFFRIDEGGDREPQRPRPDFVPRGYRLTSQNDIVRS